MRVAGNDLVQILGALFGAPNVRGRNPEQLSWGVFYTRQSGFFPMAFDPRLIGKVRFLNATIIGDVFSLSYHSVQLQKKMELSK